MATTRSIIQGLILCAVFLFYKLSSIKQKLDNTAVKEGYLNSIPQKTEISNYFNFDTVKCTYNVILRYDGPASQIKKEDFDTDICELDKIYFISKNKDIISQQYFDTNVTSEKIVYIYNEIEDVTHLQVAMAMYYNTLYSLVIEDYVVFSKKPKLWVYSALKSLLSYQKAAIVLSPSINTIDDVKDSPLSKIPISAVFTRTKTIRRLMTSTEISSDDSNALIDLTEFLFCQNQRLMYVMISEEDVDYVLLKTSSWKCNNEKFAIRSGCSDVYTNEAVAAIISVFRRPYLEQQLLQMDTNSSGISRIIIYQCMGYMDYRAVLSSCAMCRLFWSLNYDFKLLFRFLFSFAIPHRYNVFYSDDIIPSVELNTYTVECVKNNHDICGFDARQIKTVSSTLEEYTVDRNRRPQIVDYVVGMYATESHNSRTVFLAKPYTYNYAEDMHLSFSNALLCKRRTQVFNSHYAHFVSHSQDKWAVYKTEDGHRLRYQTIKYFLENRFVPRAQLYSILGPDHNFVLTKDELYYFTK